MATVRALNGKPQAYVPYTGIAKDIEEEGMIMPFNPEDISVDIKILSVDSCLRRILNGGLILDPDFQRQEVWTHEQKSRFIESLMLQIPLPMIYVSADEMNRYTVIDGLQRLSALRSFVLGDDYIKTKKEEQRGNGFRLKSLEFWSIHEGKTFDELPTNLKHRILETAFTFTVINPGTPAAAQRSIFQRINTAAEPLSNQEIRNALYIGQSVQLLNKLAESRIFKLATDSSIKSRRMEDKDLILRFVGFIVRDYRQYLEDTSVDVFLSDTMIIVNAMPDFDSYEFNRFMRKNGNRIHLEEIAVNDIERITELFDKAMNRAFVLFGKNAFRKYSNGKRRGSINKTLFEMWSVLLCQLTEIEFAQLSSHQEAFISAYKKLLESPQFQAAISKDTMKATTVKYRFETIEKLIKNHLST